MLDDTMYDRVASFLSEYASTDAGCVIPPDLVYIADAISLLISEGIFTEATMKMAALKMYDVVIPDRFFIRT